MKIAFTFPIGTEVAASVEQDGQTASGSVARWKQAHDVIVAESGRINIVERNPSASGHPSVPQVDGKYTLDLRNSTAVPDVIFNDGPRIVKLDPIPSLMGRGWGEGEHYYLPVDAENKTVVEPGRNHRKVHVTANTETQWTADKIAAAEGISVSAVGTTWLKGQTKYGSMTHPLEPVFGMTLFNSLLTDSPRGSSHWFLMERGQTYEKSLTLGLAGGVQGESLLHPILVGAWGVGPRPIHLGGLGKSNRSARFILYRDIEFMGGVGDGNNTHILYESIKAKEIGKDHQSGFSMLTLRNCEAMDNHHEVPVNGAADWQATRNNRIGTMYVTSISHMLFDGCHWSMGGWAEGYDPNNGPGPQPPSMFSHNIYADTRSYDATVRDCLSDRPASMGYMMRAGAQMYDNIAMDCGVAIQVLGGVYQDEGPIAYYSLLLGNLIHRAAVHYPVRDIGARAWARSQAAAAAWVDNIIAHAVDPNNPEEIAHKYGLIPPGSSHYLTLDRVGSQWHRLDYDNTVIVNWGGMPEQNVAVSAEQAANITAVNWYREKSGNSAATIADFYAYTRVTPTRELVHELLTYFRQGLNAFYMAPRTAATAITFRPDERGEGYRWDNRLNWTSGDIPGAVHAGDTVDLHGNDVRFGNHTAQVASLTLGGGVLDVVSGRLVTPTITGPGRVMVRKCGQLVTDEDVLTGIPVGVNGGRMRYGAAVTSDDLTIYGRSETLLGQNFTLPAGKVLSIESGLPLVGWDGTGAATLHLNGTLRLKSAPVLVATTYNTVAGGGADATVWTTGDEDLTLTWDSGSTKVADMARIFDSRRELTMHDWSAVPAVGIVVGKDTVAEITATMPTIRRFRSGVHGPVDPTVTPTVELAGPLELDLTAMVAGTYPLIEATITGAFSGLTVTNLAPTLDATVTVTGSGVTLTLASGTGQSSLV